MRLYGDYNGLYSTTKSHTIALNYDLLFNWVKTAPFKWGVLLGVQFGANFAKYNKTYCTANCNLGATLAFGGNVGTRFVIFDNYAIEILAQPRFTSAKVTTQYDYGYYTTSGSQFSAIRFEVAGIARFVYTF